MKKNEKPVPVWGKMIIALMSVASMTASVSFAAGQTLPWNIMVDGERIAMVKSKEDAMEAMQGAADEYAKGSVLDVEVKEDAVTSQVNLRKLDEGQPFSDRKSEEEIDNMSGDSFNSILSQDEAEEKLLENITVITTEEITEQKSIQYEQEYKTDPDMYAGEIKTETEGRNGTKEITKRIIRENGQQIEETVVDETVIEEPQQEVILTGTKQYDGYGGGEPAYIDEGVSYDPDAVYGTLCVPVEQVYISSHFGPRWGRMHRGTDFALAQGSSIYAADDGEVYFAGECGSYGNLVKIDHGNGMQTYYAHCSQLLVSEGEQVCKGQKIALVGATGNSTGPHLHFEVIIGGVCADPVAFMDIT